MIEKSFLEKLTEAIYLDYVLKVVGVIGFVVTFLHAWPDLSFVTKAGLILAPLMWFAGARFTKIYR